MPLPLPLPLPDLKAKSVTPVGVLFVTHVTLLCFLCEFRTNRSGTLTGTGKEIVVMQDGYRIT